MNFGELIYQQPENIKKLIRKIENFERKLANARVAILFNKTCLNIYIYMCPGAIWVRLRPGAF